MVVRETARAVGRCRSGIALAAGRDMEGHHGAITIPVERDAFAGVAAGGHEIDVQLTDSKYTRPNDVRR